MPRRSAASVAGDDQTSVFISCPFDDDYRALFDAIAAANLRAEAKTFVDRADAIHGWLGETG